MRDIGFRNSEIKANEYKKGETPKYRLEMYCGETPNLPGCLYGDPIWRTIETGRYKSYIMKWVRWHKKHFPNEGLRLKMYEAVIEYFN